MVCRSPDADEACYRKWAAVTIERLPCYHSHRTRTRYAREVADEYDTEPQAVGGDDWEHRRTWHGLLPGEAFHRPRPGDRPGDTVRPQHLRLPGVGRARDVDVRRLHHAGVGRSSYQERLHDLPEEHRHLLHCRAGLLLHRLQPDVRGRRRGDRLLQIPLRPDGRRGGPGGRAERSGGQRDQGRPLHNVRLVLPRWCSWRLPPPSFPAPSPSA